MVLEDDAITDAGIIDVLLASLAPSIERAPHALSRDLIERRRSRL